MLKLNLYITAFAHLEMQPCTPSSDRPSLRQASEPDNTDIPPMQLRRMSKAVRMGIGVAKKCLDMAELVSPDAIIVGTTMGCLQDTERFLCKMIEQDEKMLTPTAFIQSTHNTVAGQIALGLHCQGYNNTFSQHGHSFESGLVAAALLLQEHPEQQVLCGGVDELNPTTTHLQQRAGLFSESLSAGEGAGFLLLQNSANTALACIRSIHLFQEKNKQAALDQLKTILTELAFDPQVNHLWLGITENDATTLLPPESLKSSAVFFKKDLGEWGTVMSVAVTRAIQQGQDKSTVFLVNHFCGDWSVLQLELL
ncbi:MAG: beta-ketoacyl synthase chain length factor [Bacteroidetes bacterium]|nr:beta-ketoacyl synthase chain length factor [Bacteroidota bacterium]